MADQNDKDSKKDADRKLWSELSKCEKYDVECKKDKLIFDKKEISNQYNFKFYDWCFLLNAGGLIGTITLVTVKSKDPNYLVLCVVMAIIFAAGIGLIIWANLTERERFKKESERIKSIYENELKKDQVVRENFVKSINSDTYDVGKTKIIESLSVTFFVIGMAVGAVYLAIKSDDMCEGPCGCAYTNCSKNISSCEDCRIIAMSND